MPPSFPAVDFTVQVKVIGPFCGTLGLVFPALPASHHQTTDSDLKNMFFFLSIVDIRLQQYTGGFH